MFDMNSVTQYEFNWSEGTNYLDVIMQIKKVDVLRVTKEYWKTYRKMVKVKGFRGGKLSLQTAKKQLGLDPKYMMLPLFAVFANNKIVDRAPRKIIFADNHDIAEEESGDWKVTFKAYMEPLAEVEKDIVDKLVVKVPKMMNEDILVESRLTQFKMNNPYLHNKVDDQGNHITADQNDMVEASIECFIGDERFPEGCEESTNIRLHKGPMRIPEMYDRLIGCLPKSEFTIETDVIPPTFGSHPDKKMKVIVRVNNVYTCEDSEINDDLAITAGYKNLDEWKTHLRNEATAMIESRMEMQKRQMILNTAMQHIKVGDFPNEWLDAKMHEMESNKRPIDRDNLHNIFKQVTALKNVGKLLDIEWDDADKPAIERNEMGYSQKVLAKLVELAKVEYVDHFPGMHGIRNRLNQVPGKDGFVRPGMAEELQEQVQGK